MISYSTTQPHLVDVCIVGGGPSGTIAAAEIRKSGFTVTLIERSQFPRTHVGESIQSSVIPLLESIEVRSLLESEDFLRPGAAIIKWAQSSIVSYPRERELGFQVDRGRFDEILLDNARRLGVTVVQPAVPGPPKHVADNCWEIPFKSTEHSSRIGARFLIDATGRANYLRGKRSSLGANTIALFAYWRNTRLRGPETRVESGLSEWYWGAPLPDGSFNATVFVDPERVQNSNSTLELYCSLIQKSALIYKVSTGKLGKVRVCDATSLLANEPGGLDWLKVGEACFALDPISSQGVHAAIVTGIQAAAVVNTALCSPDDAQTARDFYRARTRLAAISSARFAVSFYREQAACSPTRFWEKRSEANPILKSTEVAAQRNPLSAGCLLRLSSQVEFVDVPILHRNVIRNAKGLNHPSLEHPIVHLGDIPVVPLVKEFGCARPNDIIQKWRTVVSHDFAVDLLNWMWSQRILVPFGD